MTTAERTSLLGELSFDRLRQVMFDRLHGSQSIGPSLDPRLGPAPFEWLSEEFRQGDSGLRDRMTEALRRFLVEITDLERWPALARDNLLDLVQDCGEGVVDDLRRLVRTCALLDLGGAGAPAHAGLLKCLLSLRHYGTPEFWLEQFRILGPESGALIFSGLMEHGLEAAARHLPELSAHEQVCQYIQMLIPLPQYRFGTAVVARAFQAQHRFLDPAQNLGDRDALVTSHSDLNANERDMSTDVRLAIAQLGELERKVMLAKVVHHQSWKHIAKGLGLSLDRTKALYSTAQAQLATALKDYMETRPISIPTDVHAHEREQCGHPLEAEPPPVSIAAHKVSKRFNEGRQPSKRQQLQTKQHVALAPLLTPLDPKSRSPESRILELTARINELTEHFKTHPKDHAWRRGLLMMVSKRSRLLRSLRLHNRKSYLEVLSRLGLRR